MTATTIASINEVNALLAGTTIAPLAIPAPPKAVRKAAKPKAAKKAATRTTLDGRIMLSAPGTITKGQTKRVTDYAKANGWNISDDIATWSMADAADEYLQMRQDDGKA